LGIRRRLVGDPSVVLRQDLHNIQSGGVHDDVVFCMKYYEL